MAIPMTDIWDLDPDSIEGMIARPYFAHYPKVPPLHPHAHKFTREKVEKSILDMLKSQDGQLQKKTLSLEDNEEMLDLWLSKARVRRWHDEDAGETKYFGQRTP